MFVVVQQQRAAQIYHIHHYDTFMQVVIQRVKEGRWYFEDGVGVRYPVPDHRIIMTESMLSYFR